MHTSVEGIRLTVELIQYDMVARRRRPQRSRRRPQRIWARRRCHNVRAVRRYWAQWPVRHAVSVSAGVRIHVRIVVKFPQLKTARANLVAPACQDRIPDGVLYLSWHARCRSWQLYVGILEVLVDGVP